MSEINVRHMENLTCYCKKCKKEFTYSSQDIIHKIYPVGKVFGFNNLFFTICPNCGEKWLV